MNPKLCPLCQQENLCAISSGKPADQCWCMEDLQKPFPDTPSVLMPVPKADATCYCQSCLEKMKKNKLLKNPKS
ncbi:MAG: cysteine-rich CWC family protein [Endozoicomonas sp.]|uniref:cysteine-rich CWC family protein n=1 Tax=Endozoicomonas sp. TaxID=1892382 RepID=UPI003D9B536C